MIFHKQMLNLYHLKIYLNVKTNCNINSLFNPVNYKWDKH